ncbi:MAG: precorrin-6A reductase [Clostridia bacterium]|nr:precorrin-6A reductase [Clostridia bacterium]
MYNICIFAGTTEGRRLIEIFGEYDDVRITACVATDYAKMLIAPKKTIDVMTGRMEYGEMEELFQKSRFDTVIDATHPYADKATENIKRAAHSAGLEYIRIKRAESEVSNDIAFFDRVSDAADHLSKREGNILFTTGVKDIGRFSSVTGFKERAYVRVIPAESSLKQCRDAGVLPSHIIAMQGPFSEEMNIATIKMTKAVYLVTKDGGSAGGFYEKLEAAKKTGARLLVIGRPKEDEGLAFSEAVKLLKERLGIALRPLVFVIGMGMGNEGTLTSDAAIALKDSDCIIGAKRLLCAVSDKNKPCYEAVSSDDIAKFISSHKEYTRFAAVMSGDTGFFSGAKKLINKFSFCDVKVIPGISSLSYLCAALKTPYDDAAFLSLHGRECSVANKVKNNRRLFVLLGGENTAEGLCKTLSEAGLGFVKVSIGERLGYKDEKVTTGTAMELKDGKYDSLCAALIENDRAQKSFIFGLPDNAFSRPESDGRSIPMTKSEVRAVCLSKLRLCECSVLWDIGAGTGSVSVEAARLLESGHVYSIEKREEAAKLIEKNKESFGLDNITVIRGLAPEACEDLPTPTHAFIGGSEGHIKDIADVLLKKNPNVRIVATAVSLETVSQLNSLMKDLGFTYTEVVSLSTARAKTAGEHTLMRAENPIYIFSMQTKKEAL